jgi:hypothetical protein
MTVLDVRVAGHIIDARAKKWRNPSLTAGQKNRIGHAGAILGSC